MEWKNAWISSAEGRSTSEVDQDREIHGRILSRIDFSCSVKCSIEYWVKSSVGLIPFSICEGNKLEDKSQNIEKIKETNIYLFDSNIRI